MFVSNCALSTSHNLHATLQKGEKRTYRVLLKPTRHGDFSWRFTYSNTVDSTWEDGAWSYADKPGGHFRILSCQAGCADGEGNLLSQQNVTFQGQMQKSVAPREVFSSDPLFLSIPKGHYLTFTWQLEALENDCVLPATPDSRARCYICDAGERADHAAAVYRLPGEEEGCVLPDLWDADLQVTHSIAFIGDSITQGCQTREDCYEQWASRIIQGLSEHIAGRNLGLGYARARDTALNGAWLQKCKGYDVVHVCLGVNDSGFPPQSADHAGEIIQNLQSTVAHLHAMNPQGKVVLFTMPPFDMTGEREQVRTRVNAAILESGLGADAVFDIARVLALDEEHSSLTLFGSHPDGRGGAAVAGEYLSHFWPQNRDLLLK